MQDQSTLSFSESYVGVKELLHEFGEEATMLLIFRHLDQMTLQELSVIYGITDRGVKKRLDKLEDKVRKHFSGNLP